jgi:hypothetical protein
MGSNARRLVVLLMVMSLHHLFLEESVAMFSDMADAEEQAQIEAAREDVNACIEYCTDLKQAPLHRRLQAHWQDHDRTVDLFPIEHGKTTQTEWRIIWSMGKYPERARAYVSSGERPCRKVIRNVKRMIETNERLHKVFPDLKPEIEADGTGKTCWGSLELRIEGAPTGRRDPSLAGYGWEGQITGSRLDEIYIDNVCNKKNTYTPNMRASVLEAIENDILSRLLPGGKCHVTDTSWYDDDPPHVLGEREGWDFVVEDAESGDIEGETLWPEQWPWERLEAKRGEIGQMAYDRTLRNITTSQSRGTFKRDDIDHWTGGVRWHDAISWPEDREEAVKVVTGVDLATRKGEEHDLTVFFTAQLVGNQYHLLNIRSGRMEGVEILKALLAVYRDFHVGADSSLIRVEDNAAQKYIVDMTRDAEIMSSLGATPRELASLNVEGHTTTVKKRDLEFGVPSLASDVQMGRWRFPRHPEFSRLIDEMLRWSPDDHTGDRLMAMWICREGLRPGDPEIRVV